MNFTDYLLTSFTNVRKNKLRSLLTILGVAIAIGALTSMLSFGIGLQKNINKSIHKNRMFTKVNVSSQDTLKINDSIIQVFEKIEGVEKAFIENHIPSKIIINENSSNTTIKTIPFSFKKYFSETAYLAGSFFDSDTINQIILADYFLRDLLQKSDSTINNKEIDSISLNLIGEQIEISTLTIDPDIMSNIVSTMATIMSNKLPVRDSIITFTIQGIVKGSNINNRITGAYISQQVGNTIPQMHFENIWDLMNQDDPSDLQAVSVYTKGIKETGNVQEAIKRLGYKASSMLDNMKDIKQMFIIMDSILGAIGIMALFISTLGLVNTLIMSIYERTKEIGILKSLGARDKLVRKLFLTEAGCIGFIGAIIGIPLGWTVTKIADVVLFRTLFIDVEEDIVLFSFPWYLILGSIVFSVFFSIAAGLYPARRAAKIDPVQAIRHE
jgi:putative ABC transport system permease protein